MTELALAAAVDEVPEGSAAGSAERRGSIWPHVEERVVDLIEQHRSTIVFANSRRLAERLTARFNEIAADRAGLRCAELSGGDVDQRRRAGRCRRSSWGRPGAAAGAEPVIARAHHGSVSKEQRALIEDDLKRGRLPCVVATSSLELGIDMGAVDLVVQIESPPSVASALQRVGRAGHQVGEVSRGVLLPKHRGDLVQTAVAVERMRVGRDRGAAGARPTRSTCSPSRSWPRPRVDEWDVDELFDAGPPLRAVRDAAALGVRRDPRPAQRALPVRRVRASCGRASSGTGSPARSPAGRARSGWPSPAAARSRTAACSGCSWSARRPPGSASSTRRWSTSPGSATCSRSARRRWRIEDITHDRVLVSPAPGQPGRLPFWKGDQLGRPAELGARDRRVHPRAVRDDHRAAPRRAARDAGLDDVGRRQPGRVPRRAARGDQHHARPTARCWSSGSATSSATGGS